MNIQNTTGMENTAQTGVSLLHVLMAERPNFEDGNDAHHYMLSAPEIWKAPDYVHDPSIQMPDNRAQLSGHYIAPIVEWGENGTPVFGGRFDKSILEVLHPETKIAIARVYLEVPVVGIFQVLEDGLALTGYRPLTLYHGSKNLLSASDFEAEQLTMEGMARSFKFFEAVYWKVLDGVYRAVFNEWDPYSQEETVLLPDQYDLVGGYVYPEPLQHDPTITALGDRLRTAPEEAFRCCVFEPRAAEAVAHDLYQDLLKTVSSPEGKKTINRFFTGKAWVSC